MRDYDSDTLTALAKRQLIIRHFIWITPRDLVTGGLVDPVGFWTGESSIELDVIDGQTGEAATRTYTGGGKFACDADGTPMLDQIVMEIGLAVRTANVSLNMIDAAVTDLVRGYQLRKAPVEWHFGLFDIETRVIVAPPHPLMVGMINRALITTPSRGGSGGVGLEIVSDTRKLTKISGDKRSDESQQKRQAGDRFFQDAEIMGKRELFWGQQKASVSPGGVQGVLTGRGFGNIARLLG